MFPTEKKNKTKKTPTHHPPLFSSPPPNGKYSKQTGVNQKALDQHASLSEQRESLSRRAAENAAAEEKIRQLVRTLDLRKDEALEVLKKAMGAQSAAGRQLA